MANHQSAKKRIRQSERRMVLNKYQHKTVRNSIRKLKSLKDKKEAAELFPQVVSKIDKLAKRNIIHKNKAANLKSKLSKFVNAMA